MEYHIMVPVYVYLLLQCLMTVDCTDVNAHSCVFSGETVSCHAKDFANLVRSLNKTLKSIEIISHGNDYGENGIVNFENADFSQFNSLRELVVQMGRSGDGSPCIRLPSFDGLQELKILRIKGLLCPGVVFARETFAVFHQLQVLEFTRSLYFNLTLVDLGNFISHLPIKKLTLKNVQYLNRMGNPYDANFNLSGALCPIGKTLEYVDLSFNDFLGITVDLPEAGCLPKLQFLDLRYNLLSIGHFQTNIIDNINVNTIFLSTMLWLGNVKTLLLGYQLYSEHERTLALWNDGDTISYTDLDYPQPYENNNFQHVLETYKPWLEFILTKCFHTKLQSLDCISQLDSIGDMFKLFQCIGGDMVDSMDLINLFVASNEGDLLLNLRSLLGKKCKMADKCKYGFPFPVPPRLQTLDGSHFFGYNNYNTRLFTSVKNQDTETLCLFENNDVHTVKLDDIDAFDGSYDIPFTNVRGLEKLEYYSAKYTDFKIIGQSIDMPSLREFHFSGNEIPGHGNLTRAMFDRTIKLEIVNFSSCYIESLDQDAFRHLRSLTKLDLSNNMLANVDIHLNSANMKQVFLQNNQLSTIGKQMRQDILSAAPVEIDLSGNALICDCSNIEFVEWARVAKNANVSFANSNEVMCKDSLVLQNLLTIDVEDLKRRCSQHAPVAEAVAGTLAIVAAILLTTLSYKKRWHLRHMLFVFNQKLRKDAGGGPNENHDYDAFILYSGEDRLWVHRVLVERLEKEYGMTMHIHLRDFPLGEYIADNISAAISKSRKVIAVLSPHFMRSAWCVEEVHMAHAFDQNKLVLVLYSEFPALDVEVPALIRSLMETRTYCEWADNLNAEKLFFKKLIQMLYRK